MAVVIEKRPIGVVLGSAVSANINQDYSSAFATVNKTSHGLSDGQYVYIKSNVENYNGFWRIDVINANEFILIDAPYVAWIVDANITYYPQVTTHGWSCVHLPIVYELSNNRYPTNSVDTARTISSISNDGGYVNLNLSGSLGTFEELSFLKITNAPNSDLNGVYQIIDKIATNDVTVNMAYSIVTNAGIVGATVQLYYQNYAINVRVYAGINSSHQWDDQKPYELAATLQFIPDSSNRIKFSISDILKSYVELSNNLTLATLPNNIDAWTQFYIQVAEQYDTSTGYTITTTNSGYASDQATFEGYAVNAKLPFKNVHSGYLSEYLMINSNSKFLTLFAIPVLFACSDDLPDCYNEVSFVNPMSNADLTIEKKYYSNDVLQTTVNDSINDAYPGVIRTGLDVECGYDRVDITVKAAVTSLGTSNLQNTGTGSNFSAGTTISTTIGAAGQTSKIGYIPFIAPAGSVTIQATWDVPSYLSGVYQVTYFLLDNNLNTIASSTPETVNSTFDLISQVVVATSAVSYVGVRVSWVSGGGTGVANGSGFTATSASTEVSETKQFKIDCGCANQELRLMWANYLGGFDQWNFTAEKEKSVDIAQTGETSVNTFPSWPASYGEFADTDKRMQTYRDSANRIFVYSQFLTQDEADAIAQIKSSPLVQIVNSRTDRRTVIVDSESFTKYKDGDKTYTVQFNILYTDDIPSQTV